MVLSYSIYDHVSVNQGVWKLDDDKKNLRYDEIVGAYVVPQEFGLLHYVVELLTPQRCHLIAGTLAEKDILFRLTDEAELIIDELIAMLDNDKLWALEVDTFRRNPGLGLPELLLELRSRARELMEEDKRSCFLWNRSFEPGHEFYEAWAADVANSNQKLISAQRKLGEVLGRLREMYS